VLIAQPQEVVVVWVWGCVVYVGIDMSVSPSAASVFRALPPKATVHIDTGRSRLWTVDRWLPFAEAEALFKHTSALPLDRHPEVRLYGKTMHMRRSVGFFSDVGAGYAYSGQVTKAKPLTEVLRNLLAKVNEQLGTTFNGLLINLYADGTETIGAHSDSPEGLADDGSVASLSLGADRIFRVRHKSKHAATVDVGTRHGQLLMMENCFQDEFTHEIPVQKKIFGPRVSITFRVHRPSL
jgi:alkylated DNA repair dioxygenase AlkB